MSWSAPASDGGSPISGYAVTSAPGAKTCSWTTRPLSCTVSGLTNGTAYTFTVTATNGVGTGPASAASSPVTPRTVPSAPTGVIANASGSSALVLWSAPASNGGSPITGYTATASPGGKTCSTTSALSCTVTGLADGLYTFSVTATSNAGPGLPSAPSAQVRIDTTPPSVTAPVASLASGATLGTTTVPVTLAWSGADAGSGIGHFELALSTNGRAYALMSSANVASYVRSLTPSSTTTYRFRVRAFDLAGNISAWAYGPTFHVKVYIDGVLKPTVSLNASATAWRRVIESIGWTTSASHTLKLVNVGTAGHPAIDLDALVVLG